MPDLNCSFPFMTISFLYHYPLSSNGPLTGTQSGYTQLALRVSPVYGNCFFSVILLLSSHSSAPFIYPCLFIYCSLPSAPVLLLSFMFPLLVFSSPDSIPTSFSSFACRYPPFVPLCCPCISVSSPSLHPPPSLLTSPPSLPATECFELR